MLALTKMLNGGRKELYSIILQKALHKVQLHELSLAYHYVAVNVEMVAWFNETFWVQQEALEKEKEASSFTLLRTYFLVVKIILEHRSLGFLQG